MAKPTGKNAENRAQTRARLLKSAKALFEKFGYAAVTSARIAEQAGVVEGSLFHHFATKRDLFILIHNQRQDELVAKIQLAADAANNPTDRFRMIWLTYLESTREPGMRQILLLDGPAVIGLEALRQRDRQTAFVLLQSEIETMMKLGLIQKMDSRSLSVLLFGALDQAAFEMADFPDDERLRTHLVRTFQTLITRLSKP